MKSLLVVQGACGFLMIRGPYLEPAAIGAPITVFYLCHFYLLPLRKTILPDDDLLHLNKPGGAATPIFL